MLHLKPTNTKHPPLLRYLLRQWICKMLRNCIFHSAMYCMYKVLESSWLDMHSVCVLSPHNTLLNTPLVYLFSPVLSRLCLIRFSWMLILSNFESVLTMTWGWITDYPSVQHVSHYFYHIVITNVYWLFVFYSITHFEISVYDRHKLYNLTTLTLVVLCTVI